MSFNFEWPTFSEAFYADAREMLAQVRGVRHRERVEELGRAWRWRCCGSAQIVVERLVLRGLRRTDVEHWV